MNSKYLFGAILAATTLASCSNSDDGAEVQNTREPEITSPVPIGFDAYAGRSVTRGGQPGQINNAEALQADGVGFGVFAYYTDLKKYDQTYMPNFMYNQKVEYKSGAWEYTPVMYWPNEYGSNAASDDEDKISFFAYAPYVETESAAAGSIKTTEAGKEATWGITGFSRNSTAGDPLVKYIVSFDPSKSVDLMWGVCDGTAWQRIQGTDDDRTSMAGLPWLDVEHPKGTDQKLKFTFKHALAQLGVTIDADADATTHPDGSNNGAIGSKDSEHNKLTKIYVRSISFTGIATQGSLNLNNTDANKALWLDYSGSTDLAYGQSVTIKDGRRDGREGAANAEANNELPQGLNSAIVQNTGSTTDGVTESPVNLFANSGNVYIIPTGEKMTVTIVYDVETTNADLPGYISDGTTHGSSIENRITKEISFGSGNGLESGKVYTLKLHLGMNSVKFDAAVEEWPTTATVGEGWLPGNTNP